MLPPKAVDDKTLALIIELQSKPWLSGFYLVGGTALALQFAHRRSIDIDLFSNFQFDTSPILDGLIHDFNFQLFSSASNTLRGSIGDIKVDILAHQYPYISVPEIINRVRVLSNPDIIAMKLNAIITSGQRVKDFIDIYYLLEKYSLENMIQFYRKKYNQLNDTPGLKSIIYFDDVDLTDYPVMVHPSVLKWDKVKKRLVYEVKGYVSAHKNI